MRSSFDVGLGRTGIGENFAKARLLLAKRAGYLPQGAQLSSDNGSASAMWHSVSKNLNRDAKGAGYNNPMMFLRAGAQAGGKTPGRPNKRPMLTGGGLPYANSMLASQRVENPLMLQNPLLALLRQRLLGGR